MLVWHNFVFHLIKWEKCRWGNCQLCTRSSIVYYIVHQDQLALLLIQWNFPIYLFLLKTFNFIFVLPYQV